MLELRLELSPQVCLDFLYSPSRLLLVEDRLYSNVMIVFLYESNLYQIAAVRDYRRDLKERRDLACLVFERIVQRP